MMRLVAPLVLACVLGAALPQDADAVRTPEANRIFHHIGAGIEGADAFAREHRRKAALASAPGGYHGRRLVGYKASILHFVEDPWKLAEQGRCPSDFAHQEKCDHMATQYFEEGLLVVDETGHVVAVDEYAELIKQFDDLRVVNYTDSIIMPGFIDCHTHYPQTDEIASWGDTLLQWLKDYISPAESSYYDPKVAAQSARRFTNDLIRTGTTTANIYNVIFPTGVDALFMEAASKNMRIISGLNGMANCASAYRFNTTGQSNIPLCNSLDEEDVLGEESAQVIKRQNEELISRWHNNGRGMYSLMPRFLTTATPASLEVFREMLRSGRADASLEGGDRLRFHTHIGENIDTSLESMDNFKALAVQYYNTSRVHDRDTQALLDRILTAKTQMEVFDAYGLVGTGSSFAHAIHLTYKDYDILANSGGTREFGGWIWDRASSCHCPTSNLFLGSGLFDMKTHIEEGVPFGIGTDVGGGTTYSLLKTLGEVYKVSILGARAVANILSPVPLPSIPNTKKLGKEYYFPVKESYHLSPLKQIYLITKGTAMQLGIGKYVGNFEKGKEADFVVIDKTSPVINERMRQIQNAPRFQGDLSRAEKLNMLGQKLIAISTLASDAVIKATYVMGVPQYLRSVNLASDLNSDFRAEIVAHIYDAQVYDVHGHKK